MPRTELLLALSWQMRVARRRFSGSLGGERMPVLIPSSAHLSLYLVLLLLLLPPPLDYCLLLFFFFFYPSARRGREEEGEEGKGEKRGKEQKGTGAFVTTPFRVMVFSSTTASDYRVVD